MTQEFKISPFRNKEELLEYLENNCYKRNKDYPNRFSKIRGCTYATTTTIELNENNKGYCVIEEESGSHYQDRGTIYYYYKYDKISKKLPLGNGFLQLEKYFVSFSKEYIFFFERNLHSFNLYRRCKITSFIQQKRFSWIVDKEERTKIENFIDKGI